MMGAQTGHLEPAAGYVRRSSRIKQGDNYSDAVQTAGIERLAAQQGYRLVLWEQDLERGRHTTRRAGYGRILDAARCGEVRAVLVFHTSRWGRRTAEMVERLDELDRAGVQFWAADRGRLQPGLVSTILFAVDEEFCRTLARTIRPARERGARAGVHQGPTPFGYRRIYPAWDGAGKRPPGELVRCEPAAGLVAQMFARYDAGRDSLRTLARWLNENEEVGTRPARLERWTLAGVRSVLTNVTYTGQIGYDKRPRGYYERCAPGAYFESQGHHEPLVSRDLFDRVQERMRRMSRNPASVRPAGPYVIGAPGKRREAHTYLGAGLLVCHECGGPMRPHVHPKEPGHKGSYVCRYKLTGRTDCRAVGYRMDLAHEALVREVSRLRGSPWTPSAERRLRPDGQTGRERARVLRAALDEERRQLERRIRMLTQREEPGPAELAAFDVLAQQSEARIMSLEGQLKEVECEPERVPNLRALHERLTRTELGTLLEGLDWAHRDRHVQRVRAICLDTVASAALTERQPERFSAWLRLGVTWTTDVQDLLGAGLLRLEERRSAPAG